MIEIVEINEALGSIEKNSTLENKFNLKKCYI